MRQLPSSCIVCLHVAPLVTSVAQVSDLVEILPTGVCLFVSHMLRVCLALSWPGFAALTCACMSGLLGSFPFGHTSTQREWMWAEPVICCLVTVALPTFSADVMVLYASSGCFISLQGSGFEGLAHCYLALYMSLRCRCWWCWCFCFGVPFTCILLMFDIFDFLTPAVKVSFDAPCAYKSFCIDAAAEVLKGNLHVCKASHATHFESVVFSDLHKPLPSSLALVQEQSLAQLHLRLLPSSPEGCPRFLALQALLTVTSKAAG